jgi:hypothetical protein
MYIYSNSIIGLNKNLKAIDRSNKRENLFIKKIYPITAVNSNNNVVFEDPCI